MVLKFVLLSLRRNVTLERVAFGGVPLVNGCRLRLATFQGSPSCDFASEHRLHAIVFERRLRAIFN
jgi:hypothetical protein